MSYKHEQCERIIERLAQFYDPEIINALPEPLRAWFIARLEEAQHEVRLLQHQILNQAIQEEALRRQNEARTADTRLADRESSD